MTVRTERAYRIGPLAVTTTIEPGPTDRLVDATLGLYDVRWPEADVDRRVDVDMRVIDVPPPARISGDYLEAANMLVDVAPGGLLAATSHGGRAAGTFRVDGERWLVEVPTGLADGPRSYEVEDLVALILTTGWRRAGHVPLHGAGLARDGRGLVACATSGGGKTTFTVAMIRRGWQTIGDDKLLLSAGGSSARIRALLQVLNFDPASATWFPELADLGAGTIYSVWSPKRRVPIASRWPGATIPEMSATDLLVLDRVDQRVGIVVSPLRTAGVAEALLRQTVIPTERETATMIARAIGRLASGIRGWHVVLGCDAYEDPAELDAMEAALGWC